MSEGARTTDLEESVAALFRAFNRRAAEEVTALCTPDVRFDSATADFAGRRGPYAGVEGMAAYFEDVAAIWEELLVTPRRVIVREDEALVLGRVFARGRRHGLRDLPAAWRLVSRGGLFEWIRVYDDRLAAIREWKEAVRR